MKKEHQHSNGNLVSGKQVCPELTGSSDSSSSAVYSHIPVSDATVDPSCPSTRPSLVEGFDGRQQTSVCLFDCSY